MLPENITLVGSYDCRLADLSVVIATLASYGALDLAGRVTVARGSARFGWFLCGNRRSRIFTADNIAQEAAYMLLGSHPDRRQPLVAFRQAGCDTLQHPSATQGL
jgi:hypothetical protein